MARKRYTDEQAANLRSFAERLGIETAEAEQLIDLGFEWAATEENPRLIVSASAKEKCGKTHFALGTTPEPVALIDFDLGTEGVVHKFANRRIIHKNFSTRRQKELSGEKYTQAEMEQEWTEIRSTILTMIRLPFIRTLVIDTATEMWEAARLSEFGKLDQVKSHHYGPVNREFRDIIQAVYSRKDLNALFLHKVKKEYVNDKTTGKWERAGFGDMPFLVQVNIEHYKDNTDDQGPKFGIRVVNCRQNPELDGEELEGEWCSFAKLGQLALPNSKPGDWK